MVKPRLCFTLLLSEGKFNLSRNFNLQSVGDFEWLMENYEFDSIARSIDELIILNVGNDEDDYTIFINTLQKVIKHCFMPVAVGGRIRTTDQAKSLFDNGADKIILNNAFFRDSKLVSSLANYYGTQSIIASIDYKRNEIGGAEIFLNGGTENTRHCLSEAIKNAAEIGAGELYLTSIDRDGTGMGFDVDALQVAHDSCDLPIIAAGGADTSDQLLEGLSSGYVSGVSTSHLFNFMGDGLQDARSELMKSGITLSQWNFYELDRC